MNFFISYLILGEIFAIIALSTNLLLGIIGIFSVAQAAIMGIGAYCSAVLLMAGVPFPLALLAAMALAATVNVVTSMPSLRLAGDYFIVTSFGMQLVATAVFINWASITGGSVGLRNIPVPDVAGVRVETPFLFLVLSTIALAIVSISFWLTMRSPYGRILHAIRLDELAVVAAGRKVLRAKLGISVLSGVYAGVAGSLYASYITFIDPISFNIDVSVLIVAMLVVGGARTLAGSIIGPFLLLAIPQVLSIIDLPSTSLAPARQFAYGLILIAFMLWRPQGIAGRRL